MPPAFTTATVLPGYDIAGFERHGHEKLLGAGSTIVRGKDGGDGSTVTGKGLATRIAFESHRAYFFGRAEQRHALWWLRGRKNRSDVMDCLREMPPMGYRFCLASSLLALAGCDDPQRRTPVVVTAPNVPECAMGAEFVDPVTVQSTAELQTALAAGKRMLAIEGTLDGDIVISVKAGADSPLVLVGRNGARVTGTVVLDGSSHVSIRGLSFISDGTRKWIGARSVDHLDIAGNAFDVDCFGCGDEFFGMDLDGTDIRLCGNAFGSWIGDMISIRQGNRVLVERNDFGQTQADHAVVAYLGQDLVVRRNVFRNPWDRVLHIASLEPDVLTKRAVIEHNIFVDSDWDRVRPRAVEDSDDGGGALEAVRLIGVDHIFRGNAVIATNKGNGGDCHGGVVLTTFATDTWVNEQLRGARIYQNTFVGNDKVGVGILDHLDLDKISDNRISHNVFARDVRAGISLCTGNLSMDDMLVEDNLFSAKEQIELADRGLLSPMQAEADVPQMVRGNHVADVSFADEGLLAAVSNGQQIVGLADWSPIFQALVVKDAPLATPLAFVTDVIGSNSIRVDDARPFSDGRGVVEADDVLLGGNKARIVSIAGDVLNLDMALAAKVGDGVSWAGATFVGGH